MSESKGRRMSLNLKALAGLLAAFLAVVGVLGVSVASAEEGELTADEYPAFISGGPIPETKNSVTAFGQTLECENILGEGEITGPTSEGTIFLTFEGCAAGTRAVTGTSNECTLRVHSPEGEGDEWTGLGDLECPGTKKVEIHVYNNLSHASGTWCTATLAPQTNLGGLIVFNETAEGTLKATGTIGGVKGQMHGTCSAGLTLNFNSSIHVNAKITATNELEEPIGVRID